MAARIDKPVEFGSKTLRSGQEQMRDHATRLYWETSGQMLSEKVVKNLFEGYFGEPKVEKNGHIILSDRKIGEVFEGYFGKSEVKKIHFGKPEAKIYSY
ncbi:hypothetical protein GOV13_02065 [Candidatus Pacearchaeota archaeon]|nr:hypothetical protein [Candidatus Pacearchaeota archaeon]